ncbi:DnaJ domain-containing protein [Okeanomitos corallinicola TIOX110]|uniref:DnaJ domain-containing protein n=1 Tax=Okeanomitos corallinicola TIOX110 TaxID=3133117 RepID=A0ABZ2UPI8_9CYAN
MPQKSLPLEIPELLIDPYSILGVSVNADDRQITKRYYVLAKQLHPDNFIINNKPDQGLAEIILTRLVNPAYQQLKLAKKRNDTLDKLKSKASVLSDQVIMSLKDTLHLDIESMSAQEVEFFYEQAITSYASGQYKSLENFHHVTKHINKLNLFYLSFPNNAFLETQTFAYDSTSIVPMPEVKIVDLKFSEEQKESLAEPFNYAQRHYERAIQYQQQAQWSLAVKELRDAIKLEPTNSNYYALLGVVHFQQNFPGMAKVYIRQALKLNPKHELAVKYAQLLNIEIDNTSNPKSIVKALSIASLLGRFLSRKE